MVKNKTRFPVKAIILPFSFLIGLSCFCSCISGAKSREDLLYAYLTDTSRYILLPASGIEKPMDMAQKISASYQGRDFLFVAWVKADETGIEMTFLSELGINMGELSYRDGAISFSSPVFPGSLKPEYIIADFQLCFYNPLLLSRALEKCSLVLETSGTARRILKGNELIYEIEKNADAVKLTNYLRGYVYTLEGDFS